MKNDGSLSWIVISRGMNKYVVETNKENNLLITKRWQVVPASETDRDKTKGVIESTILSCLEDVRTNWPTEVEWYSCRQ